MSQPEEERPLEEGDIDRIEPPSAGELGGIAPFHYGTQTAGDQFNVFIQKGDPYPTADPRPQTFYTRAPNQRMVSIPIYGGDDLEAASENQLQGQAFVLLPADLPANTPVRIKLWLDWNAVFRIGAHLGDGMPLDPWLVKGEADAAVIEGLQRVEEVMVRKADAISPQARGGLERGRDKVFELLQNKDFEEALEEVEELQKRADKVDIIDGNGLRQRAEGLIGYSEFLLHEYSWAFDDPGQVYRITKAVDDTKEALSKGDEAKLEEAVQALDQATDDIPQAVQLFLSLKGAILSRIQPVDPGMAASLAAEVAEFEQAFKSTGPAVLLKLDPLAQKIMAAVDEADRRRPGVARCESCGAELAGQRFCPDCNADSWLLGGRGTTSGGA